MMLGESVAGVLSPSITGSARCAVIIAPSPARTAAHERHELDRVEPRLGDRNHRQAEVRVDLGVAMPREVLPGGDHPVLLDAAHRRGAEPRDELRILPEGRASR